MWRCERFIRPLFTREGNMSGVEGDALVWIDLEMDGLDLTRNFILEIACIVTDFHLAQCFEGPDLVIQHPKSLLDAMGPWCMEHHTKSGLVQQVLSSQISMAEAEQQVMDFLEKVTEKRRTRLILAGNSVYVDRYFLEKDMPKLNALFDRSILDCSTLKELIYRFNPSIAYGAPIKGGNLHRALDDIRNSIEEFRYYQNNALEEKAKSETQTFPLGKDPTRYLVWVEIHSGEIHCILTDSSLNRIDEIKGGRTDGDLMEFFRRNGIRYERTVVVAGRYLGAVRAELRRLAPRFNEFCHYRSIDVDVVSVVCEKMFAKIYEQRPRGNVEGDLKNAIELLRFYRATIFK